MVLPPSPIQALSAEQIGSASAGVRAGSPFAAGSFGPGPELLRGPRSLPAEPEGIGEGVYRETAAAAAFAAWMLLAFATAGYVWHPAGGIATSLLGCAMGLMGLSSRHVKPSAAAAAAHLAILSACYLKLL